MLRVHDEEIYHSDDGQLYIAAVTFYDRYFNVHISLAGQPGIGQQSFTTLALLLLTRDIVVPHSSMELSSFDIALAGFYGGQQHFWREIQLMSILSSFEKPSAPAYDKPCP